MPPARKSRHSAQAAFHVLTDPSLFQSIVQFSSGVSYAVFQVKERLVCAREWKNSAAPQDVELWQNAVRIGDRRTLEALQTLSESETIGKRVRNVLSGILAYALLHTKDWELLEWIDDPDLFPKEDHSHIGWTESRRLGEQGDVEIIRWLKNREFSFSSELLVGAASKGQLALVEFLHEDGEYTFGDKTKTIELAATNGHLDVVRFLLENRPGEVRSQTLMNGAATNGHLHIVQYFHENSISGCDANAMNGAATNGHLDVVKYLHENELGGCSKAAVDGAVKNGHVEVVKFLLENRHEGFTRNAVLSAVTTTRFDILKLLCAHDSTETIRAGLPLAVELGNLVFAKYLCEAGDISACQIPREDLVNSAASSGRLDMIKLFNEHAHFRFTVKAMHNAAISNHLPIVKFLHEHRSEGCKVDTIFECESRGHTKVLDFLCSRRPMAKPETAIARAKRENRMLLAARLERHLVLAGASTTKTYEYRRL